MRWTDGEYYSIPVQTRAIRLWQGEEKAADEIQYQVQRDAEITFINFNLHLLCTN